jgi:hypothetical protein
MGFNLDNSEERATPCFGCILLVSYDGRHWFEIIAISFTSPQQSWGIGVVVPSSKSSVQAESRGLQQLAHAPNVVGDPRSHGRRHAKRFVDAAEVVEREPARDGGPVILPLLPEGVSE